MDSKTFHFKEKYLWEDLEEAKDLDSEKSVVFVFFSPKLVHSEQLHILKEHFPKSQVIGCSTSGEIAQDHIRDESITCTIAKFDKTPFKIKLVDVNGPQDSRSAGSRLVSAFPSEDLKGLFILSDGLNVNGSELIKGVNEQIVSGVGNTDHNIVVSGVLAGDGNDFEKTFIYYNGEVFDKKVLALGFYGDHIDLSFGCQGGWDIFGPKRIVTKSEGNTLFRIDDKPALELYKEYLGERAGDLPAAGLFFPLEISFSENQEKYVRTILAVDEEAQSLIFAGDIPQGSYAQFMRANLDRVVDGATDAAISTNNNTNHHDHENSISLAVSCVGRRLVLGARADDEVEVIDEQANGGKVIGFYSYGELSADRIGAPCELRNQTMTILKFSEKKAG